MAIDDVDAMPGVVVDGLHIEFVQLEDKPFSAFWTVFRLPSLVLQFGREDVMVVRHVRAPQDRFVFLVPLRITGAARWNGRLIQEGHIVVCRPGAEITAAEPAGSEVAILSVTLELASRLLAGIDARDLPGNLWLKGREAAALRERLMTIWSAVARAEGPQLTLKARKIVEELSRLLSSCLWTAGPVTEPAAELSCRDIVSRAEAFVRKHTGEPVSITKLSQVAGVSVRSLRNAFYEVYTTGPKRYFRIRQLHQVHHALREDWPATNVTSAATSHGFFELGRFAGEYKALFGEAPSRTLQRTRLRSRVHSVA